jgi:hypothetical protein
VSRSRAAAGGGLDRLAARRTRAGWAAPRSPAPSRYLLAEVLAPALGRRLPEPLAERASES